MRGYSHCGIEWTHLHSATVGYLHLFPLKTLKKMFENKGPLFPHNSIIELHRIASYRIVLNRFYQHASFLVSYRAHVSRYESDRLCHERFTPLEHMQVEILKKIYNKMPKDENRPFFPHMFEDVSETFQQQSQKSSPEIVCK